MKSMDVDLEQKMGLAEGVAVSQCLISNSWKSAIPPCVCCVRVPPPTL